MMWNQSHIKFLIKNYPKLGADYCSEQLNFTVCQIRSKASQLKLKVIKRKGHLKNPEKCNVNPLMFINPTQPEIAYLTGFLWADGYLGSHYSINSEINFEDANVLLPIFQKTGNWKTYTRTRKKSITTKFTCSSKLMYDFFSFESNSSPNKLICNVPTKLKHYFFRGYCDGDGCFYFNKKQYLRQLCFSSCYDQDWEFIISLFKEINIQKYKTSKVQRKNKKGKINSYSKVVVSNKSDITKFGEYIYQGEQFGLNRKFAKFCDIIT